MADKKKALTTKQIKKYIKDGGGTCPYCGSSTLDGDSGEFGENCSQEVSCVDCGRQWIDLYTLTGIMEA